VRRGHRLCPLVAPIAVSGTAYLAASGSTTLALAFPLATLDQFIVWTDGRISVARTTGGANEVQTFSVGAPTPTQDGVAVVYPTYGSTGSVPYNSTAAQFKTAFETAFGAGNVATSGGPWPGTPIAVTFIGIRAGVDIPGPSSYAYGLNWDGGAIASVETVKGAAGSTFDTFTVQPSKPRIWTKDYASAFPCPFTADVASLVITNQLSTRTAQVYLEAIYGS